MASPAPPQERIKEIRSLLKKRYPDAKCELTFSNPLELMIATILSAQCTDVQVNKVTRVLFRKYTRAADYANARPEVLERDIRSTGFYKNKAKSIIGSCRDIVEHYQGEVPSTMEALVNLSGIGRKTANVILGNGFGIPGIVVDTHVKRVAYRLGLTLHQDPEKIEYDLRELVPRKEWTEFSHLLIFHGRYTCVAKKPRCGECVVEHLCPKKGIKMNLKS